MLTFLTPVGALVGLAVAVPLLARVAGERRVGAVRAELGLRRPNARREARPLVAVVGVFALLALAATQPALSHETSQRVRRDAQVLFVVDTSRSMAAASGGAPRIARAESVAVRLRAAIPEVASGVATLTDRVLPDLLPVADVPSFDATVRRTVGIEKPPPRTVAARATTYAALGAIPSAGFFDPSARRRVVVLLTDGESAPFDAGAVAASLRGASLVTVRFWRADESIAGEPAYQPDPASSASLAALAAAAGGRVYGEGQAGAAGAAIRRQLGTGPTARVAARTRRETPLGPLLVLAALAPLALLLFDRGRRQE
jgi:hypothetical protein